MPTAKHLSVSTSVLYRKRNTDFSSSGALNVSTRPDSLLGKDSDIWSTNSIMELKIFVTQQMYKMLMS